MTWGRGAGIESEEFKMEYPECKKCSDGLLLPLSDYGRDGAAIHYKAWVCTNPDCGYNLKIRNGDVYLDEPIFSGTGPNPRSRP